MAISKHTIWRRKLNRIYEEQLRDLIFGRQVFREAQKIWKPYHGTYQGGDLAQWMIQNYHAFAATAVRRIAEPPKKKPPKKQRTLSLLILLEDLASDRKLLSREWYTRMYSPGLRKHGYADRDFSRIAGSESARFMPLRQIQGDIRRVREAARPLKRLVDKVYAHTEEDRRKKGRPRWRHIDNAVDVVAEVYTRYNSLLNAVSYDPLKTDNMVHVIDDLKKIWP